MSKYSTKVSQVSGLYPFLSLLSAFVTGVLLQTCFNNVLAIQWFFACFLTFAASILLHRRQSVRTVTGIARNVTILASIIILGCTAGKCADVRTKKSWYGHFTEKATALKVTITDIPTIKTRTVLVPVQVNAMCISDKWITTTGDLNLYIYRKDFNAILTPGQVLLIPDKLVSIKNSGNPFAFDLAKMYRNKGIFHQAFLSADNILQLQPGNTSPSVIFQLRQTLNNAINNNIGDSTTRALVAATLLNERNALDPELMNAYANTGIIHIIAISGMHIVLLAGAILWLLKLLPSARLKGFKYAIAIIIVWFYIALTGFPPSAVRAAVMFTLMAAGLSLNRTSNPVNIWAASGLLILCYNPCWLYDVGIQLSFLAVLSILLFYVPVKRWMAPKTKVGQWLWDVVAVSIAAQILVFPLVIYYFQQFPLLGIAANVPAALYSTVLMFGGLVIFILNAIHCSATWVGSILTFITKVFNDIITFLSDLTPQLMRDIVIDSFQYWLMMIIVVAVCIYCFRKKSVYLFAALLVGILFTGDLTGRDIVALHQEKLVVYNSGKSSQADLFTGKTATHLYTPDSGQIKYSLRPAMLGFGVNEERIDTATGSRILRVRNKRILFMGRCNINPKSSFPVDVLVISSSCVFSPQQWFQAFHPSKIVLDGSIPRWKAKQWKQALIQAGAQVHWVTEDGAFVYPQ
jgi:competence protein ComEC